MSQEKNIWTDPFLFLACSLPIIFAIIASCGAEPAKGDEPPHAPAAVAAQVECPYANYAGRYCIYRLPEMVCLETEAKRVACVPLSTLTKGE